MARSRAYRYLLGDRAREAARLRAQARLWDPASKALFDRLGVARGWRVLEIGPGQGSLHLELRRRVSGPIDAVERSAAFAARLRILTAKDGYGAGTIWQNDLIDAPLPARHYDLIFARWVFLFLPDPLAHLRKLTRALKPGGRIAIQDYHRGSFALVPEPPQWAHLVEADRAFFASQGGNVNIGCHLPQLYAAAGLTVESIEATVKTGHPKSPVWNWLTTYFTSVMKEYGEFAPLTPAEADRLLRHWRRVERHPASLLVSPAVLDVVGRKRRR